MLYFLLEVQKGRTMYTPTLESFITSWQNVLRIAMTIYFIQCSLAGTGDSVFYDVWDDAGNLVTGQLSELVSQIHQKGGTKHDLR